MTSESIPIPTDEAKVMDLYKDPSHGKFMPLGTIYFAFCAQCSEMIEVKPHKKSKHPHFLLPLLPFDKNKYKKTEVVTLAQFEKKGSKRQPDEQLTKAKSEEEDKIVDDTQQEVQQENPQETQQESQQEDCQETN